MTQHGTMTFEDHFFGRVAASLGLVTPEALQRALGDLVADAGGASLAEIMVREGLLDGEQADAVRKILSRKRRKHVKVEAGREDERALARALLASGRIAVGDLEGCMLEKERLGRRHIQLHLGEVLINRGIMAEEEVRAILRARRGEIRRCGPCDLDIHVGPAVPPARWSCPRCGGALAAAGYLELLEADDRIE